MTNEKIKQMIIELKDYLEQLNKTLENGVSEEINKTKKRYSKVLALVENLDDCFKG